MSDIKRTWFHYMSNLEVKRMFPNSSPCSQDTQTESSDFKPMEGTEGACEQERFAIDLCHVQDFLYADSNARELTMGPIPQLRQVFAIIENVCKTSNTLWVNKQQCKRLADSFSAVGEALKGLRWNRHLIRSEPSDGGSNEKYPELDKLLIVLRKGESLVSYYNTWNGSVFGWIDNRECMFKEVHEELEIMKARYHSQGFTDVGHEQDFESTSGLSRHTVNEKAKMEVMASDPLVADIWMLAGLDMDTMKSLDIIRQVKRARNLTGESLTNSGEVWKVTWSGGIYAVKVFGSYSPNRLLQQDLDFINKLNPNPFLQGLCDKSGSIVMDCMGGINLQELTESRIVPVSKECVTLPLNFYCEILDILLQAGKGMIYLYSRGDVHRDLKSLNILFNKHIIKSVKVVDFDSTVYKGAITGFWGEPEIAKLIDVYGFGRPCTEVLEGSMRKTTQRKILYGEEQEKFLNHLCDEQWRENGDEKSCLQEEPLAHPGSQLEALEVSAFKNEGSGSDAIGTCGISSKSVEDDEAQPNKALRTTSTNDSSIDVVGSSAPEENPNSPNLVHQDSTEILSGWQVPQIVNDGEPARKRNRTRIWSDDEKLALLELMEEAPRLDMGPDWNYVSDNLLEEYGFDRASISCQQQWAALLQTYRAIQDHESNVSASREFDLECSEIIDRIFAAYPLKKETRIFQVDADLPSSASSLCEFQSSPIYINHFGFGECDKALDDESTDEESEETDIQSEDEGLGVDSMATLESQAEATADSYEPCNETKAELYLKEQGSLQLETNSKYAGRKRSGEDDLIAKIAPFVNKQVEDALKPLIISVLRRRDENEQKHREEMLAIENEKLALKREKMQFRRRALANSNELPACVMQIHQNQDLAMVAASSHMAPQ